MTSGCDYSLIIPARNEGAALEATIASLRRLIDRDHAEIVVVDDASAESVAARVGEHAAIVHHRCAVRQGVAKARNLGALRARGDVLIFLDAHVCFSAQSLAILRNSARSATSGIRGCTVRIVYDEPTFAELARRHADFDPVQEPDYYGWRFEFQPQPHVVVNRICRNADAFAVPFVGACALAIRRELFQDLGGFDGGLTGYGSFEDAELALRCWSLGHDVQVVPQAICCHYTAPRPVDAPPESAGRLPLDLPRYDGSLKNALRVMSMHFPERWFAGFTQELQRAFPDRIEWTTKDQFSAETWNRCKTLEARRVRNREWLMERMTRIG